MKKVVKKMNFYVQQSISIHYLKINGITNSSVLQIGSAGIIKPVSNLYNTGGFTGPAPTASTPVPHFPFSAVPLTSPTR
jgi:spore germination protein PB